MFWTRDNRGEPCFSDTVTVLCDRTPDKTVSISQSDIMQDILAEINQLLMDQFIDCGERADLQVNRLAVDLSTWTRLSPLWPTERAAALGVSGLEMVMRANPQIDQLDLDERLTQPSAYAFRAPYRSTQEKK